MNKTIPANKHHSIKARPNIVGGTDATSGQFPYQLSLQDGAFGFYYHTCGAVIYTEKYALTVAHCVFNEILDNPYYLQVVAGDIKLYVNDGFEQISALAKITLNPNFNEYTYSSDVAILTLATPFTFDTPNVQPLPIPTSGATFTGSGTLTGWGLTSENGDPPSVLQAVSQPIMTDAACRDIYGLPNIEDAMMCAGGDGEGMCQGDSGGAFAVDDGTGTLYLAGLAVWSYRCGEAGYPDVYVELSYFQSWIVKNTP